MADRFARLESLYHATYGMTPEERAACLANACPDDVELAREVESLHAHRSAGRLSSTLTTSPPALANGTVVGTYQIVEYIARGGTGEVYRAHDTKLGRDVAVKVLRHEVASDRDLVARLEREAQLLAALDHTNIAHVYGLDVCNGTRALVMELIEGETLADRIARGPIPLHEALPIARQITEALAAAHNRDIIHRDLKPANIKVRRDGTVKVLDFGLAKNMAAMIESEATEPGTILGTALYMSPEQAGGKAVNRRADLWAFGVVLMEMLTARRVFDGDSSAAVLSAVMQATPDWSTLPADTPAAVRRLLQRCLAKDPGHRLDSAAAASLELDDALTESTRPVADTSPSRSADFAVLLDVLRRPRVLSTAALLVLALSVAVAVTAVWLYASAERVQTPDIVPITVSGDVRYPAISPDRRFVAFIRKGSIWLSQLSGDVPQKEISIVPPPAEHASYHHLTFSPDGSSIDYTIVTETDRVLWRVGSLGGMPTQVVSNVWSAVGWSPNHRQIAFVRTTGIGQDTSIIVANSDGSDAHAVANRQAPARFNSDAYLGTVNYRPSWSPDGQTLAVSGHNPKTDTDELVLLDIGSRAEPRTYPAPNGLLRQAEWLDAERLLVEVTPPEQTQQHVEGFDLSHLARSLLHTVEQPFVGGVPPAAIPAPERQGRFGFLHAGLSVLRIKDGAWTRITHEDVGTIQNFSLTDSRDVAAATRTVRWTGLWLADRNAATTRTLFDGNPADAQHFTVDNSGTVWYMCLVGGVANLYRISSDGTGSGLFYTDIADYAITPDARTIVIQHKDGSLLQMKGDRSEPHKIGMVDRGAMGLAISATRHAIVYESNENFYVVTPDDNRTTRIAHLIPLTGPRVSPSGDRVAFFSGPEAATVCDLPLCTHRIQVPIRIPIRIGRPGWFGWAPDGQSLAFHHEKNVWAQPIDGSSPYPLTNFDNSDQGIGQFEWSQNGRWLAFTRGRFYDDLVLIKGLR